MASTTPGEQKSLNLLIATAGSQTAPKPRSSVVPGADYDGVGSAVRGNKRKYGMTRPDSRS
jgi:hypothetical protein